MKFSHKYKSLALLMYDLSEYLIVISLILECRSVYNHLVGKAWISYAIVIMLAAGVLGALISQKIIYFNKSRAIAFVTIAIYLLLYIFFNSYHWSSYLRCLLCLVIIFIYYLFCYRDGIPSILYKYENVILLISVISLFFWVFGILLGIIKPSGIIHTTWSGSSESAVFPSYFNIYFKSQRDAEPFLRNSAIFTESPMFSFHVSLLFRYVLKCDRDLQSQFVSHKIKISNTHGLRFIEPVLNCLFCYSKLWSQIGCFLMLLRLSTCKHPAKIIHAALGKALCKICFWHSLTLLSVNFPPFVICLIKRGFINVSVNHFFSSCNHKICFKSF